MQQCGVISKRTINTILKLKDAYSRVAPNCTSIQKGMSLSLSMLKKLELGTFLVRVTLYECDLDIRK